MAEGDVHPLRLPDRGEGLAKAKEPRAHGGHVSGRRVMLAREGIAVGLRRSQRGTLPVDDGAKAARFEARGDALLGLRATRFIGQLQVITQLVDGSIAQREIVTRSGARARRKDGEGDGETTDER